MPPYPTATLLALLLLFSAESVAVPGPRTWHFAVAGVLLLGLLGASGGLLIQLALGGVRRWGGRFGFLLWPLLGIGAGLWLAAGLGAFGRLGTRYDALARWTLLGASCWGAGLGLLLVALQPTSGAAAGWLLARRAPLRALVSLLLLGVAAGGVYLDNTVYVGLYLTAHVALRVTTLLSLTAALALWHRALRLPSLGRRSWGALALAFALPVFVTDASHADTIQAFVSRPWPATVLRTARAALDLDRDGFSYVLGGGDCDDFAPSINPGRREIPDNGIDDNCAFGDRTSRPPADAEVPIPDEPSPMNVVLITIDTLRADRLGLAPDGRMVRDTMPELAKWSKDAVRFHRAYTPGAWTSVAVGSIMRGLYARKLRWTAYHETNNYRMLRAPATDLIEGEQLTKLFPLAWSDPHEPLAHWLQRRGMKTLAVVDDGFSQMLSSSLDAGRGFQTYREVNAEPNDKQGLLKARARKRYNRDDSATASMATSLLRYGAKKERFFMWVHFFGPHTPSTTHGGIKSYGESIAGRYDHEVRHTDKQLKRLLDALDKLEEPTAVFVTADHGEKFFDRYRSHGADLSDDVLHVPLVAKVPDWAAQDISTPVNLIDLMPTILALTRTPGPEGLDGINLGPLVQGGPSAVASPDGPRLFLSDTWQYGRDLQPFNDRVAAYDGRRKVELNRLEHAFLMYDQPQGDTRAIRMQGLAIDRYARKILGYLEEAGGGLELRK